MIKAVIFDFDGVLAESAGIKTEAFRALFSEWPDKVDEIVAYHMENMGISRYVKFRHFYENILNEPYSEKLAQELGSRFSRIVLDRIKKAPFVKGTESFLEQHCGTYLLFIASGTPQEELDDIVSTKRMGKYFKGIFGTPATKKEIIENIFSSHGLDKSEAVFVGDAESDRKAAGQTGIPFILRLTGDNRELARQERYTIEDLTTLKTTIEEIEK